MVRVHAISASARQKIEAAGGTVELLREPKVSKKPKQHIEVRAGRRSPKSRWPRGGRRSGTGVDEAATEAPETPEAPEAPEA